jgi:hypothetical protein
MTEELQRLLDKYVKWLIEECPDREYEINWLVRQMADWEQFVRCHDDEHPDNPNKC